MGFSTDDLSNEVFTCVNCALTFYDPGGYTIEIRQIGDQPVPTHLFARGLGVATCQEAAKTVFQRLHRLEQNRKELAVRLEKEARMLAEIE